MPRNSSIATYSSVANQANGGAGIVNDVRITGANTNSTNGTFTFTNGATNATFTVPTNGTYEISFEANIYNSGSDADVYVWARTGVANTAVERSAIRQTVANNHRVTVASTFTQNLTTTTPLTFAWSSTTGTPILEATAAAGVIPITPSFSVVLKQLTNSWRPENVWYVSKDSAANRYVDGGFNTPFTTVQAAITAAEAIGGLTGQVIYIGPGTYVEPALTINRGFLTFIGAPASQRANSLTTIVGSWTINITSPVDNLYGNEVVFSNLTLLQPTSVATSLATVSDVSTKKHSVVFSNTQVYARNVALSFNPAVAVDGRLYIDDSTFTQTAEAVPVGEIGPVIRHSIGALQMSRSTVIAVKNTSCLLVNQSGAIWTMNLCNFQSTTADAAALPVVQLQSEISFPTGLALCGFLYTSATPKSPAVSCGIKFGGTTGQQLVLSNCLFGLVGLGYDGYAVDVTGSAIHQVLNDGSSSFPGTAYVVNVPVSKLVALAPLLGL